MKFSYFRFFKSKSPIGFPSFCTHSKNGFTSGLKIHVTKNVQPTPEMCQEIIQCGGGEFIKATPSSSDPDLVIVSCQEDKKSLNKLAKHGVPVMDKEWLLTGLLKYKLDKKLKL